MIFPHAVIYIWWYSSILRPSRSAGTTDTSRGKNAASTPGAVVEVGRKGDMHATVARLKQLKSVPYMKLASWMFTRLSDMGRVALDL